MSKIALSSNALGTGTLTIASPNTNTDRTLTLPDNTGTLFSNADLASNAESAAGVSTTKLMTPALTTFNRANAARTRFGGVGGNFTVTGTTYSAYYTSTTLVAATNMVMLSCNYYVAATTVTVPQDLLGRLALYTAAGVLVDSYEMASAYITAQSGLGASHSVNITIIVPVTPGASYFGQVEARKSSASNLVGISNVRLDVLFV